MDDRAVQDAVQSVIQAVRDRGDAALCEFTAQWDGVELTPDTLRVPQATIDRVAVDSPFAQSFRAAVERIRRFHTEVKPQSRTFEDDSGARLGIRWTPLSAVGLYIPGGKASYPSTLAMTAVPAQIAGVERIVVVSPPGPDGEVSDSVLMAAKILGVTEIYRVGGAQAIAALALGTATVPQVDKIFGPGNMFVAEAKKQLYGEVGIDLLAGPSEVVVYADETAEPRWVAADLMAQAEHDEATRVTLLAATPGVLAAIEKAFAELLPMQPRHEIIRSARDANGRFEVVESPAAAAERINAIAPEHLSIQVAEPWQVLSLVRNAGAIFLGRYSPVAVGDYYAGPNHVLPTGRTARFASCLSTEDFMKRSNLCELKPHFIDEHGAHVEVLAEGESLPGHALSVALRRESAVEPREGEPAPSTIPPVPPTIPPVPPTIPPVPPTIPPGLPGPQARAGVRRAPAYDIVEEDAEIKLNQNEAPWDLPVELKDEVARRLRDLPWNRYHQRLPDEFRAKLATSAGVSAEQLIAGSGSNLLLQWVFHTYAGPGARVLLPSPSFSLYPLWGEVSESSCTTVRLDAALQYDVDAFCDAIAASRPAMTVLCLPNNPTGSDLDVDSVRKIASETARHGGVLVVDEAYREFSPERHDRTGLLNEFDNVILVRTFSKAFAAAGMRIGYLLAPLGIARELRKVVPPFHLSLFTAVFGLVALERRDWFTARIAEILSERRRLGEALGRLPGVEMFPSTANFFLFRVASAAEVFRGLKDQGILVRRLSGDPLLDDMLRVNVGTPAENDRFLAMASKVLKG